jgi:membrane peptidoglycan carboxypeptidase
MSNSNWQSQNKQKDPVQGGSPARKPGLLSKYMQSGDISSTRLPATSTANQAAALPQELPPEAAQQPFSTNQPPVQPARPLRRQSQFMPAFPGRGTQVIPPRSGNRDPHQQPESTSISQAQTLVISRPRKKAPVPRPWKRSRTQRVAYLMKLRRERWQRNSPSHKRISTTLLTMLIGVLFISIMSSLGYAYNFYESELPQVQSLANMQTPQSTHIYDRHGTLLYTLYANGQYGDGGRSTPISYTYLPGFLQDAQIAAEDPTFWTNNGVDPQGTLRAFLQYLSAGGQVQSGGSTMTQQLIKNLSNNAQDTLQRKTSEAALAIGLTQQYPKWKILEMYFNVTPYGAQEKGIEAAVEDYFGLRPQCSANYQCIPAVAFLDRDLTECKVTRPRINETTCQENPLLGLARASLLAGIPQNPTHFDPSVSAENLQDVLQNRQPYVLQQMLDDNMQINLGLGDKIHNIEPITPQIISEVEALTAKIKIQGFHQSMLAPHFVEWVIQTLSNQLGNNQDIDPATGISQIGYQTLITGGFNIYTTLDLNLQEFIEKDVKHNLKDKVYQEFLGTYGPLDTEYNVNDSAVVVMDAKTGEILAMDGSADYNDNSPQGGGQVNAALSYLQPGSSIKPIIYAAAFEKGWYPGMKLLDAKTYFPIGQAQSLPAQTSTYVPSDYQDSYHPDLPTDIRISIANSYNIPAVKTLMFAGLTNVANMAKRLGITAIDRDLAVNFPGETLAQAYGPSFALGTAGIPLLQMVGAYQAFADNGVHAPVHNILGIWDNYGDSLYHYDPTHPNNTQVISPQIAFLITNMLSDDYARRYEFGGIDTLTMDDWNNGQTHPVAAKTGTTDDFRDNWTVGYTSNVVVGVWSGNANGAPMANNIIGITGAGPIWHDVIEYASGRCLLDMCGDLKEATNAFPTPSGVVQAPVNPISGLAGAGVTDWMLQGEQPQQTGLVLTCGDSDSSGYGATPIPCSVGGNSSVNSNPPSAEPGASDLTPSAINGGDPMPNGTEGGNPVPNGKEGGNPVPNSPAGGNPTPNGTEGGNPVPPGSLNGTPDPSGTGANASTPAASGSPNPPGN